jgi:hypothetical protein
MMINGFRYREWVGGNQFSKELTNGILQNNYAKIMDRIIRENPLRISIINGVHLLQPQVKFVKHAHF